MIFFLIELVIVVTIILLLEGTLIAVFGIPTKKYSNEYLLSELENGKLTSHKHVDAKLGFFAKTPIRSFLGSYYYVEAHFEGQGASRKFVVKDAARIGWWSPIYRQIKDKVEA